MLTATGLVKRYGGITALAGVDFSAHAGEVHAVLGENGAGKSTLIQILSGAVPPDAGGMALSGRPFQPTGPRDAERAGIRTVFQELSLVPDMTVAENIWFRRERLTMLGTVSRADLHRRTRALLDRIGLRGIDPRQEARALSVAQRQLVEIAKALATDPAILILDEATSALPPAEVDWLLGIARGHADAGGLVLYISHRMAEVRRIADRVTVLRNGEAVGTDRTTALSDEAIVTRMLGRRLDRLYPERRPAGGGAEALRLRAFGVGHQLRDVDLALHAGEILGVAGLQGHGQRELFLALFGMLPWRGSMDLHGRPAAVRSPAEALSARIGMALLPEDRRTQGLMLGKSVRENLALPILARLRRRGLLDLGAESRAALAMVSRLRIKVDTPEQPAGTLSGGNQQKVVLGKLLLSQARILLLYDPTRGVDVGTKAEIFTLMRDLAGQGYAILFYSTDLPEVTHMAHRVAVLSYGRVAAMLEGEAISEAAILHATIAEHADAA